MTRDQATSCTMVMATTYLCYSAYFLSSDFQSISDFMKAVMAGLYVVHLVKNTRNLMICLKALGHIITQTERDNPGDVMMPALLLK